MSGAGRHLPNVTDERVTWTIQTYRDYDVLGRCLRRLRWVYPHSRIQVISDGDPDPRYRQLERRYRVRYVEGERLFGIEHGGEVVQRLLELFLEDPSDYLVKIDPDTAVLRPLGGLSPTDLPVIRGTLQHSQSGVVSIQGGCVIFTRAAAQKLRDSRLLLADDLKPPRLVWATDPDLKARALDQGLTSHDWTIGWAARTLGIAMSDHPEVRCGWRVLPIGGCHRASIVHPCPGTLPGAYARAVLSGGWRVSVRGLRRIARTFR